MKITIELPKLTVGVFVNYVFVDDSGELSMAVKSLGTDELDRARTQENT